MSDLVRFKVTIPTRWIVSSSLETVGRVEDILADYGHTIWRHLPICDGAILEGEAPRRIVTLLMACAQEYDVEAILDAIEAA